jgi:uncharacterized protein
MAHINFFILTQLDRCLLWCCSVTASFVRTARPLGLTWRAALRRLLWLSVLSATVLGSGCAWLDAKQRSIIYRPTPGIPAGFAGLKAGDERYFIAYAKPEGADKPSTSVNSTPAHHASTTAAIEPQRAASSTSVTSSASTVSGSTTTQQLEIWWLPNAQLGAPTLLYLHGTFRNLFQNQAKIEALRTAGFSVLAVEYRGWGLSSPLVPSEKSIIADADLAWQEFIRREPRPSQRVIYGHSMGTGVAVDLASRLQAPRDYGGLILESAFTSFKDIAQSAGFFPRVLASFNNENFASIDKIAKVQAPVLMLHGTVDKTIPIANGQRLFAAVPAIVTPTTTNTATANTNKTFVTIEGGAHSDLHHIGATAYQTAVKLFIKQLQSALP